MNSLSPEQEKQDNYLKSNVNNMVSMALQSGAPRFSSFLDERQQAVALNVLRHLKHNAFLLFGGAQGCERQMLGVFFDEENISEQAFPIRALKLTVGGEITHRDILGSIMGLNLKREVLGDIIINPDGALIFVANDISDFLIQNLDRIGKHTVKVTEYVGEAIQNNPQFEESGGTVPSMRLDCIVSLIINKSRTAANEKIADGLVKVNCSEVYSSAAKIDDGDVITIRGSGKFTVCSDNRRTKKDRIFVTVKKRI